LADTPRFIHYVRNTAARYRELKPLLQLIDHIEGLEAASGYSFGRA
jgi:N-acetylmuramate 1-kinase